MPTRWSILVCTNEFIFIFVDVNVDFEYVIHSSLVICNNFVNYKVLPALDSFFKLLLLLLGDINLNPGSSHINQTSDNNDVFKAQGHHFIYINIKSLLPKIEELRRIACQSNAAVMGISESKLDISIFNSEIEIDGYNMLCFDKNRYGSGLLCEK